MSQCKSNTTLLQDCNNHLSWLTTRIINDWAISLIGVISLIVVVSLIVVINLIGVISLIVVVSLIGVIRLVGVTS
jgi:hypothetical protein